MREVQFVQSPAVHINPCKGWVAYGTADKYRGTAVEPLISMGYTRFLWASVEKEEGVYDWSQVDAYIEGYRAMGKRTALGCLFANSCDHVTENFAPAYIYETCKWKKIKFYDNISRSEVWMKSVYHDDPVFLEKLGAFLDAFAAKYDGDPWVEFVDVRSLGNWGEGHSILFAHPESRKETIRRHIEMHLDRFKHTKIVICWGEEQYEDIYTDLMLRRGCGIRRDGIMGNSDGMQTLPAMGRGPGVFEFWGGYALMKKYRWWWGERSNSFDDGENLCYFFPEECRTWWTKGNTVYLDRCGGTTLEDSIRNGRPTHVGLGHGPACAMALAEEQMPLLEQYARDMGYDFFVEAAQFEEAPGNEMPFTVLLSNKGISMLYESAQPAVVLTDENGIVRAGCLCGNELSRVYPSLYTEAEGAVDTSGLPAGTYTVLAGILRGGSPLAIGMPLPAAWICPRNEDCVLRERWVALGEIKK